MQETTLPRISLCNTEMSKKWYLRPEILTHFQDNPGPVLCNLMLKKKYQWAAGERKWVVDITADTITSSFLDINRRECDLFHPSAGSGTVPLSWGSISEYLNDLEEECRRPLLQQTCKTIILSHALVRFIHYMIWDRLGMLWYTLKMKLKRRLSVATISSG